MSDHPYLQHLISDPTYGYLFPHRLSLAAFNVPNDYHLRKHYPRLTEGQHYLKIRDSDHVELIFYTFIGLLTLADLVNTPDAQAFKQALIAHTQPGGALVQAHPALLSPPPAHPAALDWATPPAYPAPRSTPAHWVAQSLHPEIVGGPPVAHLQRLRHHRNPAWAVMREHPRCRRIPPKPTTA